MMIFLVAYFLVPPQDLVGAAALNSGALVFNCIYRSYDAYFVMHNLNKSGIQTMLVHV